ncbi:hypothetical protein D3C80_1437920 [compost metagenome]
MRPPNQFSAPARRTPVRRARSFKDALSRRRPCQTGLRRGIRRKTYTAKPTPSSMETASLRNSPTSKRMTFSGAHSTMKCRQNDVEVAPMAGLAIPSAPKNSGTPKAMQSIAKPLSWGSNTWPTKNATGSA